NGLPRPFSLLLVNGDLYHYDGVSIPNGLPRPFSLNCSTVGHLAAGSVSIPNGLPRPFSPGQTSRQLTCHVLSFNPKPAPQSIYPTTLPRIIDHLIQFQSRTAFPGHLAFNSIGVQEKEEKVSIPNGLPRPFSRGIRNDDNRAQRGSNPKRAPQAI